MALPAPAPALEDVGRVFGMSCAGCHPGGGNIINRGGATLTLPDLQRNGMLSDDGLYNIIDRGRGAMPGKQQSCVLSSIHRAGFGAEGAPCRKANSDPHPHRRFWEGVHTSGERVIRSPPPCVNHPGYISI